MAYNRPPSGSMVYWRGKSELAWKFGYVSYAGGHNMTRLGRHNGDTIGGIVVDIADIDWKKYA